MTLSQNGLNYICENFGDLERCCVRTGLTWYLITPKDERLDETGGTAEIVSRFASGLAKTLTMVSPDRGTFTPEELDAANGSRVFLEDAKLIADHDDVGPLPQWCYGAEPPPEIPWALIAAGITIAAVAGVVVWKLKK